MTRLVFIDTETTSLRPDRRAWEIGAIAREPGKPDTEHLWLVDADDLDLGNADLIALKIGRFHKRHPQYRDADFNYADVRDELDVMREVEAVTRGAHLVGAVVNFDAEVLAARMRAHGICPSWHYHLIDVEALAAGCEGAQPPWESGDLSRAVGVNPDDFDRHTALGDAMWARAIYEAVIGAPS